MWTKLVILLSTTASIIAIQNVSHGYMDEIEGFMPLNGQRFDHFDWNLCSILARTDQGNVVISPISIKLLLKMLYEGSTGTSFNELAKALDLPRDKTIARVQSSNILRSLQTLNPNYNLQIGSKIYINEDISPKNWYQRILNLYYSAYIEKVDFDNSRSTVQRINNWVKYITHDQIKDFLTSDNDFKSTVMLLINAIYFKGTWMTPFAKGDTFVGKFLTPHGPQDIHYMTQSNYFYYSKSERLRSQILRLPYLGQKFSMYIILPEKPDGLGDLIRQIVPGKLRKDIWLLEETSLEVILPKFKFDYKTELKDILRQLGIRKIFESYDDMKGLTQTDKTRELVVSNIIQKAAIDLNEEGSVAVAATEFQLINKFGGSEEIFNASHPFLFFIEDESTGTIVFVGKFLYPAGYEVVVKPPTTTPKPALTTFQRRVPQYTHLGSSIFRNLTAGITG